MSTRLCTPRPLFPPPPMVFPLSLPLSLPIFLCLRLCLSFSLSGLSTCRRDGDGLFGEGDHLRVRAWHDGHRLLQAYGTRPPPGSIRVCGARLRGVWCGVRLACSRMPRRRCGACGVPTVEKARSQTSRLQTACARRGKLAMERLKRGDRTRTRTRTHLVVEAHAGPDARAHLV